MRRAQSSVEFVVLTSFMLLAFSIAIIVTQQNIADFTQVGKQASIESIEGALRNEFMLGSVMPDGYEREFTLPDSVQGLPYTARIRPEPAILADWVEFTVGNEKKIVFFQSEIIGNVTPGKNTMRKSNGILSMNLAARQPVLNYAFTTVNPTIIDSSPNHLDAIPYGPTVVAGIDGQALQFNGVNQYLERAHDARLAITGPLTITGWVKLNNYGSTVYMVVAKANANSYTPYQLGIKTSGELRFMQRASSGNTLLDGPAKIPLRRWVHFAVVRDNTGKVQFYMDGQPTGPTQTVTSPSVDYGAPLRIGLHNAGNRPLNGALDNVRIYNVALTPLEIEADRAS